MAAAALTETTEQELTKIFQVVASKGIASIEGLVKSTQPKLNKLVGETIDAFRDNPRNVDKAMNDLIARMKTLGMDVNNLTDGMEKIPDSVRSLQDALRHRSDMAVKAEKQVEELRAKGIAARIQQTDEGMQAVIMTKREIIAKTEEFQKTEESLRKEEVQLFKDTQKLHKLDKEERLVAEETLLTKNLELVEKQTKLETEKKEYLGEAADDVGGGRPDLIDPRGAFAGIADQFAAIKDSIVGPFVELGELAMGIGRSFKNFGKAMLTPIKSLKSFGAAMLVALIPMLGWALLIIAIVAIISAIIFKFVAIKDKLVEWWDKMGAWLESWHKSLSEMGNNLVAWLQNIPTMLGEALDSSLEFISDMGSMIWNSIKDALSTATDFIIDGFHSIVNGWIELINKIPGVNIPLVGKAGQAQAEQQKVSADDQGVKSKVQLDDDSKWYKPWTWGKDEDKSAAAMVAETGSVEGSKAVIVQDNKVINNAQNNAPVSQFSKADKNPEPASLWDKLTFWN